jgi:ABC-2 type transport system ATP-binding protein
MSAIVGLHPLDSGAITLDGQPLPVSLAMRRRVGFAAQAEALYPLLSGRENLLAFGRLAGVDTHTLDRRITALSHDLAISSLLDQPVRHLSGGERRRVHVAAALIGEVDVVMLDEPTAGVDPVTRANVLSLVERVAAEGASVVYSTHYLNEVEQLDGDVVMLERGQVVAAGTVSALVSRHGSSKVEMRFPDLIDTTILPWPSRWDGSVLTIDVRQPNDELPKILHALGDATMSLQSLTVIEPTLDRVFLELTGSSLQPGEGPD